MIYLLLLLYYLIQLFHTTDYNGRTFEITFLDVGQGDSSLIQFPNGKVLLIDCGNNGYGVDVVDYLTMLGIKQIDLLVTTHPDADHVGGCDVVLQRIPTVSVYDDGLMRGTKTFLDYERETKKLQNHYSLSSDRSITLDSNVISEFLVAYDSHGDFSNVNDNSIILLLVYGSDSFLFTGDCSRACERELVKTSSNLLDVDVYKAGHHGSSESSNDYFLYAVTPEVVVFSEGKNNSYGFPSPKVLDRIKIYDSKIYRTDNNGTIIISSKGNGLIIKMGGNNNKT